MSKMTRISDATSSNLDHLCKETGKSRQLLIEEAIERLSRQYFLHKANEAYESLRHNKKAWKEHLKEQSLWDNALEDGLVDE
jgi:predicted DNA-binding protein